MWWNFSALSLYEVHSWSHPSCTSYSRCHFFKAMYNFSKTSLLCTLSHDKGQYTTGLPSCLCTYTSLQWRVPAHRGLFQHQLLHYVTFTKCIPAFLFCVQKCIMFNGLGFSWDPASVKAECFHPWHMEIRIKILIVIFLLWVLMTLFNAILLFQMFCFYILV